MTDATAAAPPAITVLVKNSRRFRVAVLVSLSLMRLSSVLVMEKTHQEEEKSDEPPVYHAGNDTDIKNQQSVAASQVCAFATHGRLIRD